MNANDRNLTERNGNPQKYVVSAVSRAFSMLLKSTDQHPNFKKQQNGNERNACNDPPAAVSRLFGQDFFPQKPSPKSGVTPANQTKERPVHELFAGAFRNKSSICESCLFSQGKTPEFTKKMGEIHMNFSFCPFLWFGLPGRNPPDKRENGNKRNPKTDITGNKRNGSPRYQLQIWHVASPP